MCKQHALRIAWTIARSIAFLDFRVLRWKFTYDWKCVNTTYRVPLFCPLPASRKGLRLTLRSALFGEGGRDWRPCTKLVFVLALVNWYLKNVVSLLMFAIQSGNCIVVRNIALRVVWDYRRICNRTLRDELNKGLITTVFAAKSISKIN